MGTYCLLKKAAQASQAPQVSQVNKALQASRARNLRKERDEKRNHSAVHYMFPYTKDPPSQDGGKVGQDTSRGLAVSFSQNLELVH